MAKAELRPGPKRGRDVKRMDKPYKGREIIYTCSNGWTIERVIEAEYPMEGFFMGHCLGAPSGPSCNGPAEVFSLREPDGTPHVTIYDGVMVGRCNQAPKMKYQTLVLEGLSNAKPQVPTKLQLSYRRPDGEVFQEAV